MALKMDRKLPAPPLGRKILRPNPGSEAVCWLVGPLVGFWLHWVDGASLPCKDCCPYCPVPQYRRRYRRWYGPAWAWGKDLGRPLENGQRPLLAMIAEFSDTNAGRLGRFDLSRAPVALKLWRGPAAKSPLEFEVIDPQPENPRKPTWDVVRDLEIIWGEADMPEAETGSHSTEGLGRWDPSPERFAAMQAIVEAKTIRCSNQTEPEAPSVIRFPGKTA